MPVCESLRGLYIECSEPLPEISAPFIHHGVQAIAPYLDPYNSTDPVPGRASQVSVE
jgi:hypothetical protein